MHKQRIIHDTIHDDNKSVDKSQIVEHKAKTQSRVHSNAKSSDFALEVSVSILYILKQF